MEQKICDGTWVTMITPFTKENKIDYPGVAEIIEWYIQKGIDAFSLYASPARCSI